MNSISLEEYTITEKTDFFITCTIFFFSGINKPLFKLGKVFNTTNKYLSLFNKQKEKFVTVANVIISYKISVDSTDPFP